MLDLKNYTESMEDIEVGETKRIDHTTCDAGEDTRQRLYLTRTVADPTTVIAYCHNCQQGGRWKTDGFTEYRNNRHDSSRIPASYIHVKEIEVPNHMLSDPREWPTEAKHWALSRQMGYDTLKKYKIKYDPSSQRVFLPRGDFRESEWDNVRGYQLRDLHGQGSKYLTAQEDNTYGWSTLWPHPTEPSGRYVVIVEDLLSGIVIQEEAIESDGFAPYIYVNHGTKIDATMMYKIANDPNATYVTVWLDNDSQHVVNQAKLMARTVSMYNPKCRVRVVDEPYEDPKQYSPDEIRRALDEVW